MINWNLLNPCRALFAAASLIVMPAPAAERALDHFITARDGRLFDGDSEFRFISFDIPNLLEIEDNVGFTNSNPWRLPNLFEVNDALQSVCDMGGTVVRTYVITVARTNDLPGTPRYVLGPGKFDETSFRALDQVLASANRAGVRLVIPLVDNWPWMGGRADYARWHGQGKDAFWTDPGIIADFERTIQFILSRTNSITGVRYADDKAILCWETGNEIQSPAPWTREIARYIKSLDANHLVMDGFNASVLRPESLEIPDIDIVTTHHYPGNRRPFAELILANAEKAKGRKAYVIGEFGFVSTSQMIQALDAIDRSGASGGLLWSLRFRDRDGGFYWHSEPFGGNRYKAFHWPASSMGDPYDEKQLMSAVRAKAFAIRGLPEPSPALPAPPHLLPFKDVSAIAFQGSVGATGYQVERAARKGGPWTVLVTNVDEAATQYRPEYADESAPAGKWYYRVRAGNAAGLSDPSNIVGPVKVKYDTLVDELGDFSRVQSHTPGWQLVNRDCRSANEDATRAAGGPGDTLVYQLPTEMAGFRVFGWFPKNQSDVKFSVSEDGNDFQPCSPRTTSFYAGAGEYSYWRSAQFSAQNLHGRYLKIEFSGETQLGRVEISHRAPRQ